MNTNRIAFLAILFLLASLSAREQSPIIGHPGTIIFGPKARNRSDSEKPGHYELVAQLDRTEVDPGDTINLLISMSGYGNIHESKIFFESPPALFDFDSTYVISFILNVTTDIGSLFNQKGKVTNPLTITLGGVMKKGWDRSTLYMDMNSTDTESIAILPEKYAETTPIFYHLKIKDEIKPGSYGFILVYTYFNGEVWVGQQQEIHFKINNYVERHSIFFTICGVLLSFIAIIPLLLNGLKEIRVFSQLIMLKTKYYLSKINKTSK